MRHLLLGFGIISFFFCFNVSAQARYSLGPRTLNTIVDMCMGKTEWPSGTSQSEIDEKCDRYNSLIENKREREVDAVRNISNRQNRLRSKYDIPILENKAKEIEKEMEETSEETNNDYHTLPGRIQQINQQQKIAEKNIAVIDEKASKPNPKCITPVGGWTNSLRDRIRKRLCGYDTATQPSRRSRDTLSDEKKENRQSSLLQEINSIKREIRRLQTKLRSLLKQMEDEG
ncbi:MAG: hypothetical protein K9M51_00505 [Candidatus Gracilibacteria bacterium]|nr:hypothetical protein [Candidatus Gracilibacteria bacterium]